MKRFLGALAVLLFANLANAAVFTWDGDTSTNWFDANNWTNGAVPTADDDIVFSAGTPIYQPTIGVTSGTNFINLTLDVATTITVQRATLTCRGLVTGVGSLTKEGVGGVLQFTNNASLGFSGGTYVVGGTCTWAFTTASAVTTNGFGSGSITLENASMFRFSAPAAGTLHALTNAFIVKSTGGQIATPSSTGRSYVFTGPLSLGGLLTFGNPFGGGGNPPGGIWSGIITIDQSSVGLRHINFACGGNHGPSISDSIVDGAGGAGNPLVLSFFDSSNGRDAVLSGGTGLTYTGGTVITNSSAPGSIAVSVAATTVLGNGQILVSPSGGPLKFNSNSNVPPSFPVVTNNGTLQFAYGGQVSGFVIAGTGTVQKTGGMTATIFTNGNTYTGPTTVAYPSGIDGPITNFGTTGGLNLSGGPIVLNGTPASGSTWDDFTNRWPSGISAAVSNGYWTLSGGGFAARASNVVVGAFVGANSNSFNRAFSLGSYDVSYADASVIITNKTTLSSSQTWTLYGSNQEATTRWTIAGPVHEYAGLIDGPYTLNIIGNDRQSPRNGILRLSNTNNSFAALRAPAASSTAGGAIVIYTDDACAGTGTITVACEGSGAAAMMVMENREGGVKDFSKPVTISQGTDASGGDAAVGVWGGDIRYAGSWSIFGNRTSQPIFVGTNGTLTFAPGAILSNNSVGAAQRYNKSGVGELAISNLVVSGSNTAVYSWALYEGTLTTTASNQLTGFAGGANMNLILNPTGGNPTDTQYRRWAIRTQSQTYEMTNSTAFSYNQYIDVDAGLALRLNAISNIVLGTGEGPGTVSGITFWLTKIGAGAWRYVNTNGTVTAAGRLNGAIRVSEGTFDTSGDMGRCGLWLDGGTLLVDSTTSSPFRPTGQNNRLHITSTGGKIGVSESATASVARASGATWDGTNNKWDLGGVGTLTLAARDNYSLQFLQPAIPNLQSGETLKIERDGTGAGTVVFANTHWTNAGTLGGSGTFTLGTNGLGTCTVVNVISPGSSVGTLTIEGQFVMTTSAVYNCEIGYTSDKIAVQGDLVLDGTVNVVEQAGLSAGTYQIITYTGAFINNGLEIGTVPDGYTASISTSTTNQVNLILTGTAGAVDRIIPAVGDAIFWERNVLWP